MKKLFVTAVIGASLFSISCKPSKDQLKKTFVKSCIEEAGKTVKDEKSKKAIADYCDCAGQKVVDQFSYEELQKLDKNPNDAELNKKLEPIINTCAEALGKQLGQ